MGIFLKAIGGAVAAVAASGAYDGATIGKDSVRRTLRPCARCNQGNTHGCKNAFNHLSLSFLILAVRPLTTNTAGDWWGSNPLPSGMNGESRADLPQSPCALVVVILRDPEDNNRREACQVLCLNVYPLRRRVLDVTGVTGVTNPSRLYCSHRLSPPVCFTAVASLLLPRLVRGFFSGATDGMHSTMISVRGSSGSRPQ